MNRIVKCEFRRLIWNQFFFCIAGVLLLYGWLVLSDEVIQGIANTAPFSPWSFGYYIAHLTPIICLGELFMILLYSSNKEKMVKTITSPTPFKKSSYLVIRSGVILAALLLLGIAIFALAIGFSGVFFHEYPLVNFILPFVVTVIPLVIFCLGTGVLLSRRNPMLLLITAIVLAIGLIPCVDLYEIHFYADYPARLDILDPAFEVPIWLIAKQVILLVAGVLCYCLEWRARSVIVSEADEK